MSSRKPSNSKFSVLNTGRPSESSDYLDQVNRFKVRNHEFKLNQHKKELEKSNNFILKKLIAISLGKTSTHTHVQTATNDYIK